MSDLPLQPDRHAHVKAFFDEASNTFSYVVSDPRTKRAAIFDSVLDLDYAAGRIAYGSADAIAAFVADEGLTVDWIVETHVHADHLSAAPYLQEKLGGRLAISRRITEVQETFGKVFNEGTEFARDGSQFDRLLDDGDTYEIGSITAIAIATPGHTPACMTHIVGDAVFVGDTLFMPDGGTARADFPGGDARELYRSMKRILALPGDMRLFICHDYGPGGRAVAYETTVAAERDSNIHLKDGVSEDEFVATREARDATLAMPKLIIPSLQVNMKGGRLPEADENGRRELKVPLGGL